MRTVACTHVQATTVLGILVDLNLVKKSGDKVSVIGGGEIDRKVALALVAAHREKVRVRGRRVKDNR